MLGAVRWLHLSDFHVGMDDYAQRAMSRRILDQVRDRVAAGLGPDLVLVTGDVADRGLEAEYVEFWESFVDPLTDVLGGSLDDRLFIVPGNHDVDRSKNPAFDPDEVARTTSHYLDPTDEGHRLRHDLLLPRFEMFCDLVPGGSAFETASGGLATTVDVRGTQVGVVGINTAWLSKNDKDLGSLTPGIELLRHGLDAVAGADLVLVLGHHPMDWMRKKEQRALRALLADSSALYLHGHLHEAWTEPMYGGGADFLAVQSGASFQARDGERWRNGLLWADVDPGGKRLLLQPWEWNADHQGWTMAAQAYSDAHRTTDHPNGPWWSFPLPGTGAAVAPRSVAALPVPDGWALLGRDRLGAIAGPLDTGLALNYFDGAVPDWEVALSPSIPRREIVERLANRLAPAVESPVPVICVLLAPACEGKTTALLQAAGQVAASDASWSVLHRTVETAPLDIDGTTSVLKQPGRWLLVIDEADTVSARLLQLLVGLPAEVRERVHVLMACRDSDWLGAKANELAWHTAGTFHEERLSGLSLADAQEMVSAWDAYGPDGLGQLARVDVEVRAQTLHAAAQDTLETSSEAFFGALLTARYGDDVPRHARVLLDRLDRRKIDSGGTLRDALLYVAAMHAEGLATLSRPVLAEALGCPLEQLHRDVVTRLGREAAATSTSTYVFTRHRRIAQAVMTVAESGLGEDLADLYRSLASAALRAHRRGHYVPNLAFWRYDFPSHFMTTGRPDLAIGVSRAVLEQEPYDRKSVVNLARLLREAGDSDAARELFREKVDRMDTDRSFFMEWSVSEGTSDHRSAAVALASFSISDQCSDTWLSNDNAKRALASLGRSFEDLYETYGSVILRDALAAVAVLGLRLNLDNRTKGYYHRYIEVAKAAGGTDPMPADARRLMVDGMRAAVAVDPKELHEATPAIDDLSFTSLDRLLANPPQGPSGRSRAS